MHNLFEGRSAWIFDVDYTLYGPDASLFEQVVPRITSFVSKSLQLPLDEARDVQRKYYTAYGSTMRGMARHHGVDPHEFSDFVHDIDYGVLTENQRLKQQIAALPGKKYIFTNATMKHANDVLNGLGLSQSDFDGAFDVEMADWTPKPDRLPYDRLCATFDISADQAVFFEDTAKNLETARELGWGTVWIKSDSDSRQSGLDFQADLISESVDNALDTILKAV